MLTDVQPLDMATKGPNLVLFRDGWFGAIPPLSAIGSVGPGDDWDAAGARAHARALWGA